jgi:excisionase family DNA binding protein
VVVMADEQLLTVSQVAERLQASPYTVREWLRSGRLRGFRPGGDRLGWRVSESDLRQFIAEQRGRSGDQAED